jgi:hypothetical protein
MAEVGDSAEAARAEPRTIAFGYIAETDFLHGTSANNAWRSDRRDPQRASRASE